jgi:fumarylacetoacetase
MPALPPNYRHLPVAYNGRASTVAPSGTPITRPKGQTKPSAEEPPTYGPSRELDFELELGTFISDPSCHPIAVGKAEEHMLGLVIVNDWSARDVQRWEYQPLGPFLAKSFATSISPWIVSLDALEPFRIPGTELVPAALPHLSGIGNHHFDLVLEVYLQSAGMQGPQLISRSNSMHLYWSFAQQLAHLTSNGCNCDEGDLYASGTISGPDTGSYGSMLELAWKGTKPLLLEETGETRTFLEDGDTVSMTAYGELNGLKIGFGEVRGTVTPAVP